MSTTSLSATATSLLNLHYAILGSQPTLAQLNAYAGDYNKEVAKGAKKDAAMDMVASKILESDAAVNTLMPNLSSPTALATSILGNVGITNSKIVEFISKALDGSLLGFAFPLNQAVRVVSDYVATYKTGMAADATWDADLVAAQKVVAARPVPQAVGQSFTLTTSADNFTGGVNADTFSAVINGANGTGSTFNPGDSLTGGLGTDKLTLSLSGANANSGATLNISGFSLIGVERVEISNYDTDTTQANTHTLDMSGSTGVTEVALAGSNANGDTLVTNLRGLVNAEMSSGSGDLSIGYGSSVTLTGTTDAQNLMVNGITGGDFTAGNGFEVFNVSTSGTKSTLTSLTTGTPTSGTQTINVSGSQNLTITNALSSAVKTVNASTFTGALSVGLDTGVDTSVTGGSGNDTFKFSTGLTSADTLDGGAGIDVLSITDTLSATLSKVTNVEILNMGGASKTYDVTKIAGLTGYQIADLTSSISVNNIATGASISVLGNVTGTNTVALTAAASTLSLILDNGTLKESDGVDVAALTLTNVATLNLESKGGNLSTTSSASNSNSLDLGTTSALTKIVVTGDTSLSLDNDGTIDATIGAINSTVKTVDASAFTGRLYVTASTSASTITGGSASDSITGGTGNDVISGGAGNDTISSGGGDDNISGNDGNDSISLGAASAATKVVTVDGGAGNDTITLTDATGVFNLAGGEGDDSFVVAGGTTIYFDSSDTLTGGDGADSLTFAGTNAAAYDMATNSAFLTNVSGFESVKLDVSGLTANNQTLSFTFNDVLASSIGGGTLAISVVDAATPAAHVGADVTIDASSVLLASTKINLTGSAAVQYVYNVGAATENIVLGAQADRVNVSNVGFLAATDSLDAGTGSDTLTLAYGATSSTAVTLDLSTRVGVKGFETVNLDGVTGIGTGALTVTMSDAFAAANNDISTNTLTMTRSQFGSSTTDDTGTTKITASAVSTVKLALSGAGGADTIIGGGLGDTITGNAGNDSLTGGAGNDSFVATASMGIDTITDFDFGTSSTSVDNLNLSAYITGALLSGGTLSSKSLFSALANSTGTGTGVADDSENDIIIFDTQTFADVAALDSALEAKTFVSATTNSGLNANDAIGIWADSFGNVHVAFLDGDASTDDTDNYSITDLFILSGVTLTGITSAVSTGDFTVA